MMPATAGDDPPGAVTQQSRSGHWDNASHRRREPAVVPYGGPLMDVRAEARDRPGWILSTRRW